MPRGDLFPLVLAGAGVRLAQEGDMGSPREIREKSGIS